MSYESFSKLLSLVKPHITKQDTVFRNAVEPGLKLAVTLHHLAEGASHNSIAYHYRLGRLTVSNAIYDTCQALWTVLQPLYLKPPQGPSEWLQISEQFSKWNFYNCLGSVDGKHVTLQKPRNSGSVYFNYKSRLSLVLMAICDANYRFVFVDIGQPGGLSDGGIWEATEIGRALLNEQVNLPEPRRLPGDENGDPMPFVFVGDEAFPLKPYLMRPYPGRQLDNARRKVFNYRLSRCRRVVENTFGIMTQQWRILFKPIIAEPARAKQLVQAICVLHNFLRSESDTAYTPTGMADILTADGDIVEGFWREGAQAPMLNNGRVSTMRNSYSADAMRIREYFATYFMSPAGSVEWQDAHINQR